ncbi:unnamed protein product [Rhodiola kirilowii]
MMRKAMEFSHPRPNNKLREGDAADGEAGNRKLFETREANNGVAFIKLFILTMLVSILLIWYYRVTNIPAAGETRWLWLAMFAAELLFGLYWVVTQPVRLKVVHQHPFKDKLLQRHGDDLPSIDIFVCTADPKIEPPVMVINTILSAMSYNYPPEKLNVYLSDDGGSEFTFYALTEAASFSKQWIPFCRMFNVEPRSPEAFFAANSVLGDDEFTHQQLLHVKELFDSMKNRVVAVIRSGRVPDKVRADHKGFSEWDSEFTKQNHKSVVQIVIDGTGLNDVDAYGCKLPTLVYMAREKRPEWPHHFKAGAVNALIRVSSEISNSPIILNLDCDMYANNPDTIQEILCFFMDEERGYEIAYVQFPQNFNNITKNDHYANSDGVINEIELAGLGGYGAALYCGTGCFHRRESLCGRKFSKDNRLQLKTGNNNITRKSIDELEKAAKVFADCIYEKDSSWGKEVGLVYGCAVEDIVTGLSIQCRGWKSVYYNPMKKSFIGVAPSTLDQVLIQHRRWSQGMFQIFCSRYCPFIYGYGKIKLGVQMGYCIYLLWPICAIATLIYVLIPSVCLLGGISLFPKASRLWFVPYAYFFLAKYTYSLGEALRCGYTKKRWWNLQRMWLIRMTTSYLYAFLDTVMKQLGFSETSFTITSKTMDKSDMIKYEREIIDFGHSSFTLIIFTLAMLNLVALVTGAITLLITSDSSESTMKFVAQMILCGVLVMLYLPVYKAVAIERVVLPYVGFRCDN